MPIYAYRCEHCGFQKDVLQKMSDPLLVTCPSCGEPSFKKQVTAAGFQLKGSGWYVTDFRNPSTKEGAKDKGDSAASDGDKKPAGAPAETKSAGGESPSPGPAPAAESKPKSEASTAKTSSPPAAGSS